MLSDRIDHLVILCRDLEAGRVHYTRLLGRACDWQHDDAKAGTRSALFVLENTAIELFAPIEGGPMEGRIGELLGDRQGLLSSLALASDDIEASRRLADRRGLEPGDISSNRAEFSGTKREWSRFRCQDDRLAGLKVFYIQQTSGQIAVQSVDHGSAFRLDHILVRSGNAERAQACYGAKLGFSLALDRTNEDWGTRLLFFRLQDCVFEVMLPLSGEIDPDAPDQFAGLTWQVKNLEAARERLLASGVEVSAIRQGRKAGTRVMTVKSHTLDVPTLFLEVIAD